MMEEVKTIDALTHVEKAMGITEISKTPEHKEFLHNNSMIGELKKQIRQIEGEISKQPKESQERLRKTQIVPIEKEIVAREAKIKEYMNFRKANPKWPKKTGKDANYSEKLSRLRERKDSEGLAKDADPQSLASNIMKGVNEDFNAMNNNSLSKEQKAKVKQMVKEDEKKYGQMFRDLIQQVGYKKATSMVQGYPLSVVKSYGKGLEKQETSAKDSAPEVYNPVTCMMERVVVKDGGNDKFKAEVLAKKILPKVESGIGRKLSSNEYESMVNMIVNGVIEDADDAIYTFKSRK